MPLKMLKKTVIETDLQTQLLHVVTQIPEAGINIVLSRVSVKQLFTAQPD